MYYYSIFREEAMKGKSNDIETAGTVLYDFLNALQMKEYGRLLIRNEKIRNGTALDVEDKVH